MGLFLTYVGATPAKVKYGITLTNQVNPASNIMRKVCGGYYAMVFSKNISLLLLSMSCILGKLFHEYDSFPSTHVGLAGSNTRTD